MAPLFSVHCAAYNHARFVEDAVRSVLAQTLEDLEMIVVDDGSVDSTWSRLQELQKEDGRLVVLRHGSGSHLGRGPSLRRAIEHSTGRYLARIDSDDRWLPKKLEWQLPALEGGVLLCYGRARTIDEEGRAVTSAHGSDTVGPSPDELRSWVGLSPFEGLLLTNYIPAATVALPRAAYERVGGYPFHLVWEDYALWIRVLALDRPAYVDEVLAEHRLHGSQAGRRVLAAERDLQEDLAVIEYLRDWANLPVELREAVDSWCRCHAAVAALVRGELERSEGGLREERLRKEDAHRLALLLKNRLARIAELTSLRRVSSWTGRILGLGQPFDEVRRVYRSYIARRLYRAYREKHFVDGARWATAYSAIVMSDRIRRIRLGIWGDAA